MIPEITTENVDQVEKCLKQMSWLPGHKYGALCLCKNYLQGKVPIKYIQPEKPRSYKPMLLYTPPCGEFPQDTIYKKSYMPIDKKTFKQCRGESAAPKPVITPSGDFSPHTTQRLSYGPIPYVKPEKCYPQGYHLKGSGRMQEITTHKHDFTPKPIEKLESFKYVENMELPDAPFESKTTQTMSYTPYDINCIDRPKPYRQKQETELLTDPFSKDTVYKTSYLPTKMECKVPKCRPEYKKPQVPFTSKTIYSGSFLPPGQFLEDSQPIQEGNTGCYCVYPGECIVEKFKKAHDYSDGSTEEIKTEKK